MTINKDDEVSTRGIEYSQLGVNKLGFADPSGALPKQPYFFGPSTNLAARGHRRNELNIGGSTTGLSFNLPPMIASQYPYNDVYETQSGHVIEYDDTPGGERILIKHKSGSGVELRSDGSIVMKTESNMVTSVSGSSALIVEGNLDIRSAGNLTLKVAGDLTFDVGGNIKFTSGGDKVENIAGASRENVGGTKGSVVKGSRSNTTVGSQTDTSLSGRTDIVKGAQKQITSGDFTQSVGGASKSTAASMIVSTSSMTMAAAAMSIFGASGTMGGEGIVHYGATFRGNTFYGDLKGTAEFAITADVTNSQVYPAGETGTPEEYVVVIDAAVTANASSATMEAYLNESANGVVSVVVDEGDFIKNTIDKTFDNGGVSSRDLSTTETRSRLRDPASMGNSQFVGNAVSTGKLAPNYSQSVPKGVDRIASSSGTVRTPHQPSVSRLGVIDRYQPKKSTTNPVIPPPQYNPALATSITPNTELAKGVILAKFLGGTGDKVTLAHITSDEEKLQIARQFVLHAKAVSTILENKGEFKNHRLIVVEGLYKKEETETLTPDSINDRATRGEVVVYELHDNSGKPDPDKTYELATYWKDTILFDKLILSYDTFDPSGIVACQIILIMPKINDKYQPASKYKNQLETLFNNKSQGLELIEITDA